MYLKFFYIFSMAILLFFPLVQADISQTDYEQIAYEIDELQVAINNGSLNYFNEKFSPNIKSHKKNNISSIINNYDINYTFSIEKIEKVQDNVFEVKGSSKASGLDNFGSWEYNGFSNYFIFEKVDNEFLLLDTNFHTKFGSGFVWNYIKNILIVLIIIFLIFGSFWLWMLIDCLTREFDEKVLWALMIIFLQIIGAILYFFMIRKKLVEKGDIK